MGHWPKIKAGKRVHIKELPQAVKSLPIELELLETGDQHKSTVKAKLKTSVVQKKKDAKPKLKVPSTASVLDPLIAAAKKSLKENQYHWRGELSYTSSNEIDIKVSKDRIDRTIAFMDSLIKLLKSRGYKIEIDFRESYVVILDQRIQFSFRERQKKASRVDKSGRPETVLLSTGILCLKIGSGYSSKEFVDGKILIEDQLDQIIAYTEQKGKEDYDRKIRYKAEQEIRKEKERIQKELEERQAKELSNFKILLSQMKRWHRLKLLREFINEVHAEHLTANTLTEERQQWIEWAKQKADWYDPAINAEDELLATVDKDSLTLPAKHTYW